MLILGLITVFVLMAVLVILSAVQPRHETMSRFELERRAATGDKWAQSAIDREGLLGDVTSLLRVTSALLLVIIVCVAIAMLGWSGGIIFSLVIALLYGAFGRTASIHKLADRLYRRYEPQLLRFTRNAAGFMGFVRIVLPTSTVYQIDSREELQYLVNRTQGILTADQKKFITHSLKFDERQVSEIMTPRAMIDSVPATELLGPLVLNDLHKTGHSRFPVTDGDIDHVVGMLHIQDLLAINSGKSSSTAAKTMEPRVFYIRQDQTLQHALAAFLRTRHHLFVVVNEFRETVGLLSLEDVIEALLGRKIVDEFDMHDDLRAVAARKVETNNRPPSGVDV